MSRRLDLEHPAQPHGSMREARAPSLSAPKARARFAGKTQPKAIHRHCPRERRRRDRAIVTKRAPQEMIRSAIAAAGFVHASRSIPSRRDASASSRALSSFAMTGMVARQHNGTERAQRTCAHAALVSSKATSSRLLNRSANNASISARLSAAPA